MRHYKIQYLGVSYLGSHSRVRGESFRISLRMSTPRMSTPRMSTPRMSTPKMATFQNVNCHNVNSQNVNFLGGFHQYLLVTKVQLDVQ